MKKMFSLDGEVSIITGGASGIGKAIAKGFYEYGSNVVIADLNDEELSSTVDEINGLAGENRCLDYKCDVTDIEQVKKLKSLAVEVFGKITVLVNSHGIARRNWAVDMSEKEFDDVISVNLKGVYLCTSEIGKYMVQEKKGSIINISSIAAHVCMPRNVNYCTAKGGVASMTRAFGAEWAKYGVRVNAIAPGPCRTKFTEEIYRDHEYVKALLTKIPLNRVADPKDMVGPAILLSSEAGAGIVGQTIIVDGGYSII